MFANLNNYRNTDSAWAKARYRRAMLASLVDSLCWIYAAPVVAAVLAWGGLLVAALVCRAVGYDIGFHSAAHTLANSMLWPVIQANVNPMRGLAFVLYLWTALPALARVMG